MMYPVVFVIGFASGIMLWRKFGERIEALIRDKLRK